MKQNANVPEEIRKAVCGTCGALTDPAQNFCPVCGTPQKSPIQLLKNAKHGESTAYGILLDCLERPVRLAALAITKKKSVSERIADAVLQNITAIEADTAESFEQQLSERIFQKSMDYMIDQLAGGEDAKAASVTIHPMILKH